MLCDRCWKHPSRFVCAFVSYRTGQGSHEKNVWNADRRFGEQSSLPIQWETTVPRHTANTIYYTLKKEEDREICVYGHRCMCVCVCVYKHIYVWLWVLSDKRHTYKFAIRILLDAMWMMCWLFMSLVYCFDVSCVRVFSVGECVQVHVFAIRNASYCTKYLRWICSKTRIK